MEHCSEVLNYCCINFLLSQLETTDHPYTCWPSNSPRPSALPSCRLPQVKRQTPPAALPWGIAISSLSSDRYKLSIISQCYAEGVIHWWIFSSSHHLNWQNGGSSESRKDAGRECTRSSVTSEQCHLGVHRLQGMGAPSSKDLAFWRRIPRSPKKMANIVWCSISDLNCLIHLGGRYCVGSEESKEDWILRSEA